MLECAKRYIIHDVLTMTFGGDGPFHDTRLVTSIVRPRVLTWRSTREDVRRETDSRHQRPVSIHHVIRYHNCFVFFPQKLWEPCILNIYFSFLYKFFFSYFKGIKSSYLISSTTKTINKKFSICNVFFCVGWRGVA